MINNDKYKDKGYHSLEMMNTIKYCKTCNIELNEKTQYKSFMQRGFNICSLCSENKKKKHYKVLREKVIANLGGKCACCGESEYIKLSIDHINGGGLKEKKELSSYMKYFRKLIKQKDILDYYQCLCYNCNYCKGFYGKCWHKV